MKKTAMLAMSLAPVAALASVGSVAVSDVDAAEILTITEVVYEYDGQEVVADFSALSGAMLDGDGAMYEFALDHRISAIGLSNGEYIDFMDYASAVLDGDQVNDIFTELSEDPIPDSEVSAYATLDGFESDGSPVVIGGDVVIPEVISIE